MSLVVALLLLVLPQCSFTNPQAILSAQGLIIFFQSTRARRWRSHSCRKSCNLREINDFFARRRFWCTLLRELSGPFSELIKELNLSLLFNLLIPSPNGYPVTSLGETTPTRGGQLFVMSVQYSKQRRSSTPRQTGKHRNRIKPGTGLLWLLGSREIEGIVLMNKLDWSENGKKRGETEYDNLCVYGSCWKEYTFSLVLHCTLSDCCKELRPIFLAKLNQSCAWISSRLSRALHQLHLFAWRSDWCTRLSVYLVIGQRDYFGIGYRNTRM